MAAILLARHPVQRAYWMLRGAVPSADEPGLGDRAADEAQRQLAAPRVAAAVPSRAAVRQADR